MKLLLRFLSAILILPCFYLSSTLMMYPDVIFNIVAVPEDPTVEMLYGLIVSVLVLVGIFAGCAFTVIFLVENPNE